MNFKKIGLPMNVLKKLFVVGLFLIVFLIGGCESNVGQKAVVISSHCQGNGNPVIGILCEQFCEVKNMSCVGYDSASCNAFTRHNQFMCLDSADEVRVFIVGDKWGTKGE